MVNNNGLIGNKTERSDNGLGEDSDTMLVNDYCQIMIDDMISQDEAKEIIIADLEKGSLTIDQARQIAHTLQLQ